MACICRFTLVSSSTTGLRAASASSALFRKADFSVFQSALIKRAEKAEAALKPVVDELTGVKRQIHAMTAAVFGKHLFLNTSNVSSHVLSVY